jgi:hypothetical protein
MSLAWTSTTPNKIRINGDRDMGNYKKKPKYNVVSMRVNDAEKIALEELTQQCNTSVSRLMREAIQLYAPLVKTGTVQR